DLVEANELTARRTRMSETGTILLGDSTGDGVELPLTEDDMDKRPLTVLPRHTNALTMTAVASAAETVDEDTYSSLAQGFATSEPEFREKERAAEAGADAGGDAGAGSGAEAGAGSGPDAGAGSEVGSGSEFAVSESVVDAELESSSGGLPYPFHSGAELLQ